MSSHLTAADIDKLVSRQDIEGLIAALESNDAGTRWLATNGLGELCDPRAIDYLTHVLNDPDPDVRWKAAEALGSIGDIRATETLIPLLKDPDDAMRLQAIWALGRIRDQHAMPYLVPFLTDSDYDTKIASIWAFGSLGGRRASEVLREMLLDRHPGIRSKVAESLKRCGWRPASNRERGALAFAQRDWDVVSRYGRALGDVLIWALDDAYFDVRQHAARILGTTKSRHAVAPLRKALDDPEECVTYEAAAALAEIGNSESKEGLIHALGSPHLSTRKIAAGALSRLGWEPQSLYHKILFLSAADDWIGFVKLKERGVRPLAQELTGRKGAERESITKALKAIGGPATDALIRLLKNPDPDIRWRAASILGDCGDKWAIEPLVFALKDPDELVASSAAIALGALKDESAADPLIQACEAGNPNLYRNSILALGMIGSRQATDTIIRASDDENPDIRISAIQAMGMIGDARVLPALLSFFEDPDPTLRFEAVQAIRRYQGQEIDNHLTEALGDPDAQVRYETVRQIGQRRTIAATEQLVNLFEDPDVEVRRAAAGALRRIGWKPADPDEHLGYLIATEDWGEIQRLGLLPDPVRDQGGDRPTILPGGLQDKVLQPTPFEGQTLRVDRGETPGREKKDTEMHEEVPALEYFIGVLDSPDAGVQVRVKAAEALGNLGDVRGVRPLMNALRDPDDGVRAHVALSLGMLGDQEAFGALAVALEDPVFEVKRQAAEALSTLKSRGAVLPLTEMAKNPDPGSRILALQVLGNFEEDDAVRALLIALSDEDPKVKSSAMESLLKLVNYWGSRTSLFLKDTDPTIRKNTIIALKSLLGEDKTLSNLLPLLKVDSFSVRREVVLALQAMGWQPDQPDEYATAMIANKKWDEVVALGKQAESSLIDALFDTDRTIQDGAVMTLARIGDARTARSIRMALRRGRDIQVKGAYAAMKAANLIEEEHQEGDKDGPVSSPMNQ